MIYPVITIRQPWAAQIVRGHKDVENRNWRLPDKYRNCTVLIHSSANPLFSVREATREIAIRGLPAPISYPIHATLSGNIIGAVRFNGCEFAMHHGHKPITPWCDTESAFWWMIAKAQALPPIPAKGKLRFWEFDYPHKIVWP